MFQSHNGAIAAKLPAVSPVKSHVFQSHNGAIAANIAETTAAAKRSFNPTMVRLLRSLYLSSVSRTRLFQSHNGAIAAVLV